jgi:phosphate uptake regulator
MVEEKIRSVYKLGESTLVMSLPKTWTESIRLKKGDKLIVHEEKDGTLSLSPRNLVGRGLSEIEISINTLDVDDLERKIIAKYIDGYSLIKLKADNGLFTSHHHNIIRGSVSKLIGLNIMELTSEEVFIQSLLDPSELPIRKGLERTHALASSMFKGALKALLTSDDIMAKNILKMRIDLMRFYYLVLRQLRSSLLRSDVLRRLKMEPIDCLDALTASQIIMRVAKNVEQILKNIITLKNYRIPREIALLVNVFGEKALNIYDKSVIAFLNNGPLNFSIKVAQSDINAESLKLNTKLAEAREEGIPCEVMCHIIQIVDRIGRIGDQGIELAETIIYSSIQ